MGSRLFRLETLHDCQGLLYVLVGCEAIIFRRQCRDDLAVFADDERGALDKVMVDRNTAHIRLAWFYGGLVQIVRGRDIALCVGGDRKLPGAILRIRRELIEPRNAVGRYTNDRGASSVELVFHLSKCV